MGRISFKKFFLIGIVLFLLAVLLFLGFITYGWLRKAQLPKLESSVIEQSPVSSELKIPINEEDVVFHGSILVKKNATFLGTVSIENKDLKVINGNVVASNLLYAIFGGPGISVSPGQTPTITNTGVLSLNGQTGDVTLSTTTTTTITSTAGVSSIGGAAGMITLGSGLSINGNTLANSDLGSGQNIFKTIAIEDGNSFSASSNTDTLTFIAGPGITISNPSAHQLMFEAIGGGGTTMPWSSLTNPSANLSLSLGSYTTNFTYDATTGTANLFTLTDSVSNTGTGYLLNLETAVGSTLQPLRIAAGGVDALHVNALGNIGIGTPIPAAVLDVIGTFRSSSTVTFSTFTQNGGPLYTNGSGVLAQTTAGTANQVLHGGTNPSFGLVDVTSDISGVLPIANGGTNTNTVGTAGSVAYSNGSAYAFTTAGTATECLLGGATPTFGSCGAGGVTLWNQANGALFPQNSTVDLLVGGQSSISAKFAVLNVNSGTPTASVSGTNGATYITADGALATTRRRTLTIGNSASSNTTGNVLIHPSGIGNVGIGTSAPQYKLDVAGAMRSLDILTQDIVLSAGFANTIKAIIGYSGYTSFTGGLGTGSSDSILGAQRLTNTGNLTNIGSLQGGETLLTTGGTFAAKADYAITSGGSTTPAIGDVNGDGKADMVVPNRGGSSVSVFLNNGAGTFAAKVDYTTGVNPTSVAIGDVNGDGKADLAVANDDATTSILLGTGTGTFAAKVDYEGRNDPRTIRLADVNGDGKADMVLANPTDSNVIVILNNGDGTFSFANLISASFPASVAVADVNGDGKADIVTANDSENSVSVFLGVGDGTFPTQVDYATGIAPQNAAVADVNGDGKADIVTANYAANTVSVFFNNGAGTFAAKADYTAGGNPNFVAIGDMNGDGKPDIATANDTGSTLSILLNNGAGTFAAKVDYATLANAKGIVIGDVSADGKADLVVTYTSVAFTSVFLNVARPMFYAQSSTGNVGVGTTTPVAKFEVKGTTTGGVIAKFTDVNTTGCSLVTGGTISCSSDSRLKKNIEDLSYGLDDLMALRPVLYNWNTESDSTERSLGFIAQDVEAILPKLVLTDPITGLKELNTIGMVPLLTKSLQQLNNKFDTFSLQSELISDVTLNNSFVALAQKREQDEMRIKKLEDSYAELASGSAKREEAVLGVVTQEALEVENATVSGKLAVSGRTLLSDVGITGDISAGLLRIEGLDGAIKTLGGDLKLQDEGLGGIDMLAGKVMIDKKGNMTVVEAITAKKIVTDEFVVGDQSVGTASIKAGTSSIEIDTSLGTPESKIFVTPHTLTTQQLAITRRGDGHFTVSVSSPTSAPIVFDWWILSKK